MANRRLVWSHPHAAHAKLRAVSLPPGRCCLSAGPPGGQEVPRRSAPLDDPWHGYWRGAAMRVAHLVFWGDPSVSLGFTGKSKGQPSFWGFPSKRTDSFMPDPLFALSGDLRAA